jgi:GTP cyclohydrolase FolE2
MFRIWASGSVCSEWGGTCRVDEHLPFVVRVCLHPLAVVDCVRRIQHRLVRGLEHFRVTVRSSNYR